MENSNAVTPQSTRIVEPVITVRDLTKVYEKPRERGISLGRKGTDASTFVAVDQISFDVKPGEIFVIMGLSGSGKSTIIRMLNRLIDITDGEVFVHGQDVRALEKSQLRDYRNKTINMVFQHFGLFPHKTLIENVAFGLKVRGVTQKERVAKAAEALRVVGLGDRLYALPEQLSGGQQQRVGLARALATDAEILLMDEPFSALDPLIRKEMQDLLVELQTSLNKTIIFVTHDLNEAMRLGDKILVMNQGKMAQLAEPIELLEKPANTYIEEFTAEVDRSRVVTARMLADQSSSGATGATLPQVEPDTKLNELLQVFAEGIQNVEVVRSSDARRYGTISWQRAIQALAPKGQTE